MTFNLDMHRLLQPHLDALMAARGQARDCERLDTRQFVEQALAGMAISDALVISWQRFLSLRPEAQAKLAKVAAAGSLNRFDPYLHQPCKTGKRRAPDLGRLTPEMLANEALRFSAKNAKKAMLVDLRGSREDFLKERADLRRA